jgi:hypothetical protein
VLLAPSLDAWGNVGTKVSPGRVEEAAVIHLDTKPNKTVKLIGLERW